MLAPVSAEYSSLKFLSALTQAKEKLLVVGQNLHSLTQSRFKEAAFEKLRNDNIELQLLLCDPEIRHLVLATRGFAGDTFIEDLKEAIGFFSKWQKQADEEKNSGLMKGSLEIRLSKRLGNLSFTFLDPENINGAMEITPVPYASRSVSRPRFLLNRRDNDDIFQIYWSSYDMIYRSGGSRSIRDLKSYNEK